MPDPVALGSGALERKLLGEAPHLTREEVEESACVPPESARRLWRSLGFVDAQAGVPVFTAADVAALRLTMRLEADQMLEEPEVEAYTRVIGQSMSRMAEAQTELMLSMVSRDAEVQAAAGVSRELAAEEAVRRFGHLLPDLEWLLTYAWRRHVCAAVQRALAGALRDLPETPVAVGFCDIVGYTSLTRDMRADDLAALVETFEALASDIVVRHGGRVIKTLGDEVMFLVEDAVVAAEAGLALAEAFTGDGPMPRVRVGLAWGPVVTHGGDLFGPIVNLASRCTGIARPGAVVCERDMAAALAGDERFTVTPLRARRVRGFEHLTPWVIRRR